MAGKVYVGTRNARDEVRVLVVQGVGGSKPLPMHLDLFAHSPSGFEWGFAGSGPAQLALAILMDVFDDRATATEWHQRFKFDRIATLPAREGWSISEGEVREWHREQIETHAKEARRG